MSIRASNPELPASAGARWASARDFVARCRDWAAAEIERRAADGRPAHEWHSYLKFTDHTLRELDEGTLDGWFDGSAP